MSESTFHKEQSTSLTSSPHNRAAAFATVTCSLLTAHRSPLTAHRGMGLTEVHWNAKLDCLYECYDQFGLPQELRDEIDASFNKYKPAIVGNPSYRDVVLEQPDVDVTKGR